jgi:hypothetical protein
MLRVRLADRLDLRRFGWALLASFMIAFAVFEVVKHDLGTGPILLFGLLPDVTLVAGIRHRGRRLPARAFHFYNAAHSPIGPVALLVVTSLGVYEFLDLFWFVGGLSWLAHIAMDRALGFRPRIAPTSSLGPHRSGAGQEARP